MSGPRSLKVINQIEYLTFLTLGKAKGAETIIKVHVEKWCSLQIDKLMTEVNFVSSIAIPGQHFVQQ